MKIRSLATVLMVFAATLGCQRSQPTPMEQAYKAFGEGQWQETVDMCDRMISESGAPLQQRVDAYILRGRAQLGRGDIDAAIADYTAAIELNPHAVEGYYNRAIAYDQQGNDVLAMADRQKAREADPRYRTAYMNELDTPRDSLAERFKMKREETIHGPEKTDNDETKDKVADEQEQEAEKTEEARLAALRRQLFSPEEEELLSKKVAPLDSGPGLSPLWTSGTDSIIAPQGSMLKNWLDEQELLRKQAVIPKLPKLPGQEEPADAEAKQDAAPEKKPDDGIVRRQEEPARQPLVPWTTGHPELRQQQVTTTGITRAYEPGLPSASLRYQQDVTRRQTARAQVPSGAAGLDTLPMFDPFAVRRSALPPSAAGPSAAEQRQPVQPGTPTAQLPRTPVPTTGPVFQQRIPFPQNTPTTGLNSRQ